MVKIYLKKLDFEISKSEISPFAYQLLKELTLKELTAKSNISLEIDKSKKPYFENLNEIKFNISHTENLIAIAISDKEIGIDAEKQRPINLNIKNRFSSEEKNYINTSVERFFEVWTKKEAFFKYKGDGIKKGFSSFNVLNPIFEGLIKTFYLGDYIVSVCSQENINENNFIFLENM